MKIGSEVWVHCNDAIIGSKIVVILTGKLVGETKESITISAGRYIFVILWQDIVYMERWEEENL